MLQKLKEILQDYQDISFPGSVPREAILDRVEGKASVCMGVRRSGKSTYLFQLIKSLLDSGVSRENILYLNFFDDRLHSLNRETIGLVMEAYHSLYPSKKGNETIHCFFDEIQVVDGWEPFVDRILRMEGCEVTITGSSADLLSREIATQLRGRVISCELFPFSFREFLAANDIPAEKNLSSKQRLIIENAFEKYFMIGGFPETVHLEDRTRIKIHQEYFTAMLFRDIVERHDASHPRAITDLANKLIDNTASLYTINKSTNHLRASGHKVHKRLVSDYLSWFEDAYFLFSVPIFDASMARVAVNPKKVYCIDHAMVTSLSSGILINSGHLLENIVFIALRRSGSTIRYYKTRNGKEVDFIVVQRGNPLKLIQVAETLANPETLHREESALLEALEELDIQAGTIVTRYQEQLPRPLDDRISVVPAWRFLLENHQ